MTSPRVKIITDVMAAWSRHDIEGVLEPMADDVLWHYHVGSRPVQGREAMGRFLAKLADHQQQLNWRLVRAAENDDAVLVEGTDDYVNPQGNRVQAPYMGVFEFAPDDRIIGWRDYVDMATMQIGERGEPLPEWLQVLVDR